jgi:hypothetical protein
MRARFMSQDPQRWICYKALFEVAGTDAAARDRDGLLLERVFEGLRRFGIIGKPPLQPGEAVDRLGLYLVPCVNSHFGPQSLAQCHLFRCSQGQRR